MTEPLPLRPRELAELLLSSGEMLPRQRARDQRADLVGLDLKRRVLEMLAAIDPAPDELESTLLHIVAAIGEPTGPARAVAGGVREEWRTACTSPTWIEQLRLEARAKEQA